MASQLRSSFRAIPSSFVNKAAPTVPPASQTFEPLVKHAFTARQFNIFTNTAFGTWIVAAVWASWQGAGTSSWVFSVIQPSTFALAVALWVAAALPSVVQRKIRLKDVRAVTTSPSAAVKRAFTSPGALRTALVYGISAVAVLFIHLSMAAAIEPVDPRVGLFARSKKHPFHLNGRFLFLLAAQLSLAFTFFTRNAMLDRFAIRWLSNNSPSTRQSQFLLFPSSAVTAAILAIFSLVLSMFAFGITRSILLRVILRLPLLRSLFRPFVGLFLRSRAGFTFFLPMRYLGLLFRAYFLSFATALTWEFAESVFEEVISTPISVVPVSASPTVTLVSGITAVDDYLRISAYRELSELARDSSPAAAAARTALFTDQKHNPTLWAVIARRTLVLLGVDYQRLLARGKEPEKSTPTSAPAAPTPANQTTTPLIHRPIFKESVSASPMRSLVDGLASDGPINRIVEETTEHTKLPDLFRSIHVPRGPAALEEPKAKVQALVQAAPSSSLDISGLVTRATAQADTTIRQSVPALASVYDRLAMWWTRERVSRVAEACLPRRELDVLAIEVLSYLTCASLEEDTYGVVQRDIPRILEAFLSFLAAIESYQAEITSRVVPLTPEKIQELDAREAETQHLVNEEAAKAGVVLGVVGDALKEGISRIVKRFGTKLNAFKFPPATGAKLQTFVDYTL